MKKKRLFHEIRSRIEEEEEEGAFKIPVAGGEPITVALKYGNRGAGSAYRRLDKRCDARSIGPPTDPCARAPFLSLSLSLSRLRSPRPAIICYVRDSKLTAILAFCHSYVSPGRPRVLTPGRDQPRSPSRGFPPPSAIGLRSRTEIKELSRSILDTRGNLSLCLCFNSSSDLNSLVKVADFIARDFIALCIIFVLR